MHSKSSCVKTSVKKKSFCTFRQNSEPMTHELYSGKGKAYNDHVISSITPGTFIIA